MNENTESHTIPDQIGGTKPSDWEHEGELTDLSQEDERPSEQTPDDHGDGPITNKKNGEQPY